MMPVRGDHSARMPAAIGSSSRIRSGPISSSPSTPFAVARTLMSARRGSSSSASAMTSLPG